MKLELTSTGLQRAVLAVGCAVLVACGNRTDGPAAPVAGAAQAPATVDAKASQAGAANESKPEPSAAAAASKPEQSSAASSAQPGQSGAEADAKPAQPAQAQAGATDKASQIEQIKLAVELWQQGRIKIDDVRDTPIPGIYEARSGTELIYVHEGARYVFLEGQLIDMLSNESLTQKRMDEVLMVKFDDLPLEYAIKQVNGKGTRKLAVFEDPNCGHCRNLRRELNNVDDLTIYTFTLPILARDSESKARKAWCAPDKVKAWNAMMLEGKVPDNDGSCKNPVADVSELAKKLSIRGTPTVFFANGKRLPGGVPGDQLRKMIAENSGKA